MKLASKILIIISICFAGLFLFLFFIGAMFSCSTLGGNMGGSALKSILFITSFIEMALLTAPIIVGSIALNMLSKATTKKELAAIAIVTLILCNMISGILMLCMKDEDLVPKQ